MKLLTFTRILERYLDSELIEICYEFYHAAWREARWKYEIRNVVRWNPGPNIAELADLAFVYKCRPRSVECDYSPDNNNISCSVRLTNNLPYSLDNEAFCVTTRLANKYVSLSLYPIAYADYDIRIFQDKIWIYDHVVGGVCEDDSCQILILFVVDLFYSYLKMTKISSDELTLE